MDIVSVVLIIVGVIMLTAALATWLLLRKEEVREETQAGPGGQPFLAPAIAEKTPPGPDQFEKEIISQVSEPDPLAGLEAELAPYGPQGEPPTTLDVVIPINETKALPKPSICKYCKGTFKNATGLSAHIRFKHKKKGKAKAAGLIK